ERGEVAYLPEAVTAELQAVRQYPDANLARIKDVFEVVCGGSISVGDVHLGKGGPVENGTPCSLIEVLDEMHYEALSGSKTNPEPPFLPGYLMPINGETHSLRLRDRDRLEIGARPLGEIGNVLRCCD